MKPTIVTLSGGNDGGSVEVASFQEAFGEFSEARGRGRERRAARKADRQEKKQQRQVGRQQTKSAKRQARIAKRADAQQARQQKRTTKVAMAQERRMQRKQGRVQRKALGQEEDALEEDKIPTTQEEQGASSEQEQEQGGVDNQTQDTTDEPQQEGAAEGEYETTQDSDVEAGDEGAEDAEIDAEQGESDEESGFTGELGFDGAIAMSPEDAQWNEFFSSAAGKKKINPKVKLLARRIEQRKHMIKVLEKNFAKAQKRATQIANKIQAKINNQKGILAKMEAKLASYSKFEGDYSEARGGKSGVAKRKAEVRVAKKEARKERKAAVKAVRQQRRADKRSAKHGGNETPVDRELNPEISDQRIEVPASEENSGFNGTGLIGIDEQNDVDAPETRKFDLKFSNADGVKPSIGVKEVLIGAAIGVAAILIIRQATKGKK